MQDVHQTRRSARYIANALGEKEKLPQHQIKRIVQICGSQQSMNWLREVQALEKRGGMPTSNGGQRRTPGGAFFKLVRSRLLESGQHEKMQIIFRGKKVPDQYISARHGKKRGPRRPAGKSFSRSDKPVNHTRPSGGNRS